MQPCKGAELVVVHMVYIFSTRWAKDNTKTMQENMIVLLAQVQEDCRHGATLMVAVLPGAS